MDLSVVKMLLTPEQLAEAEKPLAESRRKQAFLRAFLRSHCQVMATLEEISADAEELLVWRNEDKAFDDVYRYYEKLANEDLAASTRKAAIDSDDLKVKVTVLQALSPEHNIKLTATRPVGRPSKMMEMDELETYVQRDDAGNMRIEDPIAAIAARNVMDVIEIPSAEQIVSAIPKPAEGVGPIKELVEESLTHGIGMELVRFLEPSKKEAK